jgi:hypothetical protein
MSGSVKEVLRCLGSETQRAATNKVAFDRRDGRLSAILHPAIVEPLMAEAVRDVI